MVHSYCCVHHLLWYTYGLMFYCLVWFTFTVCFISGYGSLLKCDCSTHSGTLRFQWWISFFQVHLPCMIIRCTRFTPRHWFNLSVRFTYSFFEVIFITGSLIITIFILLTPSSLKHHDWIIVGQVHFCGIGLFTWLGSLIKIVFISLLLVHLWAIMLLSFQQVHSSQRLIDYYPWFTWFF